ncbi:MAG: hypothetical protein ACYS8Y_02640 [Planctomycetota bacterium]|jgi:hypothetical protein
MSEAVRLGDILPEVFANIEKRTRFRRSMPDSRRSSAGAEMSCSNQI